MPFTLANLSEPRLWLRDVVQPALDDFAAAPLDLRRAYAALILVYQHHERLYHYLKVKRPHVLTGAGIERFRIDMGNIIPMFDAVAAAAATDAGQTLKYSNIMTVGALMALAGTSAEKVKRAVIVTRLNRQLLPMLEDVVEAYGRLHEMFKI